MATLDHDERPAIALYEALRSMGADTDQVLRLTIRAMDGRYVGEVVLSAADAERLRLAAACHPEPDDDLDTSDAALVIAEAEAVIVAAQMGGTEAGRPRATNSARTPRRWKIWRRR